MAEQNSKDIHKKLDLIVSKIDKLLIWKAEHTKSHELVERDVADNRAMLFDNPGLISKVNTLWTCKKDITKWREFWLKILQYLIVAGIVTVITWLLMVYKKG